MPVSMRQGDVKLQWKLQQHKAPYEAVAPPRRLLLISWTVKWNLADDDSCHMDFQDLLSLDPWETQKSKNALSYVIGLVRPFADNRALSGELEGVNHRRRPISLSPSWHRPSVRSLLFDHGPRLSPRGADRHTWSRSDGCLVKVSMATLC
jgi:hypothetical protein